MGRGWSMKTVDEHCEGRLGSWESFCSMFVWSYKGGEDLEMFNSFLDSRLIHFSEEPLLCFVHLLLVLPLTLWSGGLSDFKEHW